MQCKRESNVTLIDRAGDTRPSTPVLRQGLFHYRDNGHTATMVSSLLSFAGQKELARRVRPSSRRTGQTAETAEATENTEALPESV